MLTRGEKNIKWIQRYCVQPSGQPVRLAKVQIETILLLYDAGVSFPVRGRLAAYLALLHTVGPLAPQEPPALTTDIFTVWNAAGPELRQFIRREGAAVVCPELGLRYPRAA